MSDAVPTLHTVRVEIARELRSLHEVSGRNDHPSATRDTHLINLRSAAEMLRVLDSKGGAGQVVTAYRPGLASDPHGFGRFTDHVEATHRSVMTASLV